MHFFIHCSSEFFEKPSPYRLSNSAVQYVSTMVLGKLNEWVLHREAASAHHCFSFRPVHPSVGHMWLTVEKLGRPRGKTDCGKAVAVAFFTATNVLRFRASMYVCISDVCTDKDKSQCLSLIHSLAQASVARGMASFLAWWMKSK